MRKIVRDYVTTTYDVLESVEGKVNQIGSVVIEGEHNMVKARKQLLKNFPEHNAFLGNYNTESATYSMSAEKFMQLAEKE